MKVIFVSVYYQRNVYTLISENFISGMLIYLFQRIGYNVDISVSKYIVSGVLMKTVSCL